MFIKNGFIKNGTDKIVNLANVSNIYIDLHDNNSGKVIFNMNYSVKIFGDKITPDYVYWNFGNFEALQSMKSLIEKNIENWIYPQEPGQRYVNPKCVSSIGMDNYKNRVIFNLNYNVTHPTKSDKLTSDFVFFNFPTKHKFENFSNTLAQLNNKIYI